MIQNSDDLFLSNVDKKRDLIHLEITIVIYNKFNEYLRYVNIVNLVDCFSPKSICCMLYKTAISAINSTRLLIASNEIIGHFEFNL